MVRGWAELGRGLIEQRWSTCLLKEQRDTLLERRWRRDSRWSHTGAADAAEGKLQKMQRSTQRHRPSVALCDCGGDTQIRHGWLFFYFIFLFSRYGNIKPARQTAQVIFSVGGKSHQRGAKSGWLRSTSGENPPLP